MAVIKTPGDSSERETPERIECVLHQSKLLIGLDVSWLKEHDEAVLEEYGELMKAHSELVCQTTDALGMIDDQAFIDNLYYHSIRAKQERERASNGPE